MRNALRIGIKALPLIAAMLAMPVIGYAQDAANPYRGSGVSQQDLTRTRARGSEQVPINQADLSNNSANYSVTGGNRIDQSFGNSGGIISVIQNTGNNSLFQHSTTVNVTAR
jgi:hypothetical protein